MAGGSEENNKTPKPPDSPEPPKPAAPTMVETEQVVEYDDFGLPIPPRSPAWYTRDDDEGQDETAAAPPADESQHQQQQHQERGEQNAAKSPTEKTENDGSNSEEDDFDDALATPPPPTESPASGETVSQAEPAAGKEAKLRQPIVKEQPSNAEDTKSPGGVAAVKGEGNVAASKKDSEPVTPAEEVDDTWPPSKPTASDPQKDAPSKETSDTRIAEAGDTKSEKVVLQDKANENPEVALASPTFKRDSKRDSKLDSKRDSTQKPPVAVNGVSEYSHQQVIMSVKDDADDDDDGGWQDMPAFAPYDMYDDNNRLIAKEYNEVEEEDKTYSYAGMGGAGKGYTRVLVDEDAQSATSMDENTNYLFKNAAGTSIAEEDEETRDALAQMQATKDLLTEGQKIAYVGLARLEVAQMLKDMEKLQSSRSTKKVVQLATEALKMWGQKIMIRIYTHMDISAAEQVMIEQLAEHGVISSDLTPQLMANARVKNPMAERKGSASSSRPVSIASPKPSHSGLSSPRSETPKISRTFNVDEEMPAEPPPAYNKHEGEELPAVRLPNQLPSSAKLDIDIRWTILCDLFLVLIADSIYDSRSRVLFERVGKALEIDWVDICRFEKRVTEALEMQQQAERENWNEDEHMETRRKLALKKRYMFMGLATVGGGLVIGLSAGLLAPVIGAGLAAGFTTIGVTGTTSFLGGAAASAIITSGAAASGSVIGIRAADRRTGAVKTFEYRPLHNNKRVNLIVTISGWMTGKVDDVRLPFSTVDPVMGDMYSVLWEPDMLTSMGDTINILATEVSLD